VPTLRTTLGVKGHRPLVGHLDWHNYIYVFGALNLVRGRLTTRLVARPQKRKRPHVATQRQLQAGFATHVRALAQASPASYHPRVVVVIDKAPWHRGAVINEVLAV
jgi:hypothetical protein